MISAQPGHEEARVNFKAQYENFIGGTPFYMSKSQYEYWKHTQLIIDVVNGRGGMFSLEGPEGVRFLTRSRLFTEEEQSMLSEN